MEETLMQKRFEIVGGGKPSHRAAKQLSGYAAKLEAAGLKVAKIYHTEDVEDYSTSSVNLSKIFSLYLLSIALKG